MKLMLISLVAAATAWGGEMVYFRSGLSLAAERTERKDGKIILFRGGGSIELPAAEIERVEVVEEATSDALSYPAVPSAPETPKPTPRELVRQAAERYGLPPALLEALAQVESGYRVDAVSPKGAQGLMQLMPGTAAELQADARDPVQNAEAGARYLRMLLERFGYSAHRALAAYNAGPGAVEKYGGIPPYPETRTYVNRVLSEFLKRQRGTSSASLSGF
jgi:soluble lytic murein transglycosylase-like protein